MNEKLTVALIELLTALTATLHKLNGQLPEQIAPASAAPIEKTRGPGRPPKHSETAESEPQRPKPGPGPRDLPAKAPEYPEVVTALKAVAAKHGSALAVDCLSRFGVQKAPQLKADQYAEFIAVCNAALDTGSVPTTVDDVV